MTEFVEFTGRLDGQEKWGPHIVARKHINGVFQSDTGFALDTDVGTFDLGKDRRDELAAKLVGAE